LTLNFSPQRRKERKERLHHRDAENAEKDFTTETQRTQRNTIVILSAAKNPVSSFPSFVSRTAVSAVAIG